MDIICVLHIIVSLTVNAFFILLIIININIEYGNPFNIVCWRETQDLGEICAKYCYVV